MKKFDLYVIIGILGIIGNTYLVGYLLGPAPIKALEYIVAVLFLLVEIGTLVLLSSIFPELKRLRDESEVISFKYKRLNYDDYILSPEEIEAELEKYKKENE